MPLFKAGATSQSTVFLGVRCMVAMVGLSTAFSTLTITIRKYLGVFFSERMPMVAVGPSGHSGASKPRAIASAHVFSGSDYLHMRWVDAVVDFAEMVNGQSFRNWSNQGFVRPSVSKVHFPISTDKELAITRVVEAGCPQPARIRLIDLCPEAVRWALFSVWIDPARQLRSPLMNVPPSVYILKHSGER